MIMREPSGRGAAPSIATTVASATSRPDSLQARAMSVSSAVSSKSSLPSDRLLNVAYDVDVAQDAGIGAVDSPSLTPIEDGARPLVAGKPGQGGKQPGGKGAGKAGHSVIEGRHRNRRPRRLSNGDNSFLSDPRHVGQRDDGGRDLLADQPGGAHGQRRTHAEFRGGIHEESCRKESAGFGAKGVFRSAHDRQLGEMRTVKSDHMMQQRPPPRSFGLPFIRPETNAAACRQNHASFSTGHFV